jgi:ATP-dependent DNA helicase HFM1/MER3
VPPNTFSTPGRPPFDTPYHTQPAPFTGPNRISLAPRNMYNQFDQEDRALSNAENHFRFAQNLREGMPINLAPQRSSNVRSLGPMGPKRNILFSQQSTNSKSVDPIDQLANAMLIQTSVPPTQVEPETAGFFQGLHPNRINQLQSQRQQITPPFNLSKSTVSFPVNT